VGFNAKQLEILAKPINTSRIAKRSQGGKQLSYLEAWDVKAHLIRVCGYGNFDSELLDYGHVTTREYESVNEKRPMVEVIYFARVRLTVRDEAGDFICTYVEGACGSASGPVGMLGEQHDNALKTAESDALKRCAINLGNQFGLSLYDNGTTSDVVKGTALDESKPNAPQGNAEKEAADRVAHSLGATPVEEPAKS
jgi:recombination DNA repair RAD52 pathway protein